ncbi:MAG: hypothetical protein ACI8XC_000969 [Gammaproteobacteria bacterium]|jgi:hypothetical protein
MLFLQEQKTVTEKLLSLQAPICKFFRGGIHVLSLLCLMLISMDATAAVDVTVDRNPVQVNESFQLVFEADKTPDAEPDFSPLQHHFVILNRQQSSSISIINGDYQRSVKWTVQLMPKQVGKIMVPAIKIGNEKTRPVELNVVPASQALSAKGNSLIHEIKVEKDSAYVQSQIIVTQRLLISESIAAYQFGDLDFNQFDVLVEPLGEVRQYDTRIADRAYLVLERKLAIFPQQSGLLELKPALAEVRFPSSRRSLFDPFQNGGEIRRVRSEAVRVEIKAPQPGVLPWIPASKLTLTELDAGQPLEVIAGEPVTRTITVSANGLTAIQLPEINMVDLKGVKLYPDQPELENKRNSNGLNGQRQQKFALVPTTVGRYRLPEIVFNWWNTASDQLETASLPAREIIVSAPLQLEVTAIKSSESKLTGSTGDRAMSSEAVNPFWIWCSLFLATGWLITAMVWWLRRRRENSIDSGVKTEQPEKFRGSLNQLKKACKSNDRQAVRECLLVWANALVGENRYQYLQQIGNGFGADFKLAFTDLNQGLFSQESSDWDGLQFLSICEQVVTQKRQSESVETPVLQPLNP